MPLATEDSFKYALDLHSEEDTRNLQDPFQSKSQKPALLDYKGISVQEKQHSLGILLLLLAVEYLSLRQVM